jgi:hypothetical protein
MFSWTYLHVATHPICSENSPPLFYYFLAHLAKGNVSFCHHFASVVCRPLTFPMFVNESGQNEQSLERIFHRCFLPSFTSFGWGVSEEKIKMWNVNGRRTTDVKWWQKLTLPLARRAKNAKFLVRFMFEPNLWINDHWMASYKKRLKIPKV